MEIRPIETMGGEVVNDIFFTDCAVPAENLLGVEGAAWMQLMAGLNVERLILAALLLGIAQRAFDDTLSYVKEREQFGRPIGSFQALKHRIADLATEIECCRLLTYDVARKVDANPGRAVPREASMAKLKVTETAKHVALEGMQMMGGYRLRHRVRHGGHVRTTLVSTIYGGTSEIQRDIIGKTLDCEHGPAAARRVRGARADAGLTVWRAFNDIRLLSTSGYATLLQVAHPTVGHGVHQYSSFTKDPWGRLLRTLDYVHGTIYGGPELAGEIGKRVRELHRTIKGEKPDGERYSAMEPDAFAWVHATLAASVVEGHGCSRGRWSSGRRRRSGGSGRTSGA